MSARERSSLAYFNADVSAANRSLPLAGKDRSFWRKEAPEIDEEGKVVRGGMFTHQRAWWNLDTFVRAVISGYGGGKTLIGAKRVISLALENPGCMIGAVSPTFALARKTTIPTLETLLDGKQKHFGRQFWWRHNKSTHQFLIRFKGRDGIIQIMSGDDPSSLRGPNLAAAWMDEPFLMEQDVFTQMMARVRHPDARVKEIDLTGTPESISDWGYELFHGELRQRLDASKTTVGLVQASSRENLALGEDYVRRLEGALTERAALAFIEGQFVNLNEGAVYYGFQSAPPPEGNVAKLPIPDYAELGVGMDFNVSPMACVVFWRMGKRIHVFDNIELNNADTEFMCQTLREKYVDMETKTTGATIPPLRFVYPDPSGVQRHTNAPMGKTDLHFIREAGFEVQVRHAHPGLRNIYNAVNGKFRPKVGEPTLTIDPKCKKLIKGLHLYSHDLMHKPEQQAMNHSLSALSYAVEFLYPVNRERAGTVRLEGM